ncbi:hypothetical protein V1512DRAFT_268249 [Lipomyces arxii]|uniref:uncharacterized protein n=1 Tax=Lipomyces arxii TaxID=56418 RepID=UPI0034CE59B3
MTDRITRLAAWLKSRDVHISSLVTATPIADRGIGVIAAKPAKKGTHIFQFPLPALLNPYTARASLFKNESVEYVSKKVVDETSSHQLLAYFLYHEMTTENSEWEAFVDVLPTLADFDTVPLVWHVLKSEQNLIDLLPLKTRAHVTRMITQFEDDIAVVGSVFCQQIDVQVFLRAWMCVNSRCLFLKIPGAPPEDCMTLAPMIDFLNHSDQPQCSISVTSIRGRKRFCLTTTQDYQAGAEIFLSYGAHVNGFLLCEYGFTLESNMYTELDISGQVMQLLDDNKKQFLQTEGYLDDYTLTMDALSYRTEVALAVAQSDIICNADSSSKTATLQLAQLRAFISGRSDGVRYRAKSQVLLSKIAVGVIEEAERVVACLGDDMNACNIRRLYDERMRIAKTYIC